MCGKNPLRQEYDRGYDAGFRAGWAAAMAPEDEEAEGHAAQVVQAISTEWRSINPGWGDSAPVGLD